jgi:hypothetical protein
MKRPAIAVLLAATGLISLGGCASAHRLPNIKAEEIHVSASYLGLVTTNADATGINVTDTMLRAADVSWVVTFFGYTQKVTAKGYQQRREKEDKP